MLLIFFSPVHAFVSVLFSLVHALIFYIFFNLVPAVIFYLVHVFCFSLVHALNFLSRSCS